MKLFYLLFIFVVIQRLVELYIATNNERWMKARGGIEIGQSHYKWFIWLHTLFFIAIFVEYQYKLIKYDGLLPFYMLFFFGFLIAQLGRVWCIYTLGRFWNTKIIVLPKVSLIRKGPYKYVKHPNYIIVFIELLFIPLIFGLYMTAFIFPFLHLLLLTVRVPVEEEALDRISSSE